MTIDIPHWKCCFSQSGHVSSSCSVEKSPMVPNPEPKQYWNNWKNDMSLFSATNHERPYANNWRFLVVSTPFSSLLCPPLLDKQNCQPLRLCIISLRFLRKRKKLCLTTALHFWMGWVPSSPNLQNPRSFSSFPFEMLVMIWYAWLSESVPDGVQTARVGLTDLALLPP